MSGLAMEAGDYRDGDYSSRQRRSRSMPDTPDNHDVNQQLVVWFATFVAIITDLARNPI